MPAWNMPRTGHGRGSPQTIPAAGVSRLTALIGDSLTEHAFGATPFYWQNGLLGAPFQLIANSGHSGQTIGGLGSQLATDYKAATAPGLAGLPALGWIVLRVGTNNARGAVDSTGVAFDSFHAADYDGLIAAALTYAAHVIIMPVPPIGGSSVTKNLTIPDYNAYLQAKCEADPTHLHWIDDCTDLVDGSGNVIPEYFDADELHMNGAGAYRMAQTAKPLLEALIANQGYTSPLVTDAADVYPAQPQWVPNPVMAGTSGTLGSGFTGTVATGYRVELYGSGETGVCSVVAADVADPNQTPWQRIAPTSANATGAAAVIFDGDGRAFASDDPDEFEQLVEFRFNALRWWHEIWYWMQSSGGTRVTKYAKLKWQASVATTAVATLQQKFYREGAGATGTPRHYIYFFCGGAGSGDFGSLDFRCLSVRG